MEEYTSEDMPSQDVRKVSFFACQHLVLETPPKALLHKRLRRFDGGLKAWVGGEKGETHSLIQDKG